MQEAPYLAREVSGEQENLMKDMEVVDKDDGPISLFVHEGKIINLELVAGTEWDEYPPEDDDELNIYFIGGDSMELDRPTGELFIQKFITYHELKNPKRHPPDGG